MSGPVVEVLIRNCDMVPPCRDGHYEMRGICHNCDKKYLLRIPRGHEAPVGSRSWECPNCGCEKVTAQWNLRS